MSLLKDFIEQVWSMRVEYHSSNKSWSGDGIVFVEHDFYLELHNSYIDRDLSVHREFHDNDTVFGMKVFPVGSNYKNEKPPLLKIRFN